MIEINACDEKGLTQERLSSFASSINDETISCMKNNVEFAKCTKDSLVSDCFEHQFDEKIAESDFFVLKADSAIIAFDGANFLWWSKTDKRLEKLDACIHSTKVKKERKKKQEEKTIADEQTYSVGVATLIDAGLTNIHHFKGSKQECIDFINKDIFDRYIDESLNAQVVINLAFDEDEFNKAFSSNSDEEKMKYKRNIELWYTIQELESIGAISTK